jgi:ectoine hydroxylase-related dioxygenase (phytanoyl-CoA dioxygenase family)
MDQLRQDVAECGYGVMLDALSPDLLARLKARVLAQAQGEREAGVAYFFGDDQTGMPATKGGRADAPNQRLGHLLNKGAVFRELLTHPLVRATAPQIIGPRYLLSSLSAMIMNKGGVAQVLHSDQQFAPWPTPVALVCNIVWMLVDFTPENGATRLAPGTHRLPPPTIRFETGADGSRTLVQAEATTVIAAAPAGSALVFDGRIWHGAGANTTPTPRPAIFSYYCQPYIRQQENLPMSLNEDVYLALSDAERALIGFEAHNRGMGRIAPALGRANTNWPDSAVGVLGD